MTEAHFEHSYDYDGMASLNEDEDNDVDYTYEYIREITTEYLGEEINQIFKYLVIDKDNKTHIYYKNNPKKFWEHLQAICKYELEHLDKKKE